jgi:hypothetical protein
MVSSGIRLGAWDYLRWGHVSPIYRNDGNGNSNSDDIVSAKIMVYAGEEEQYFTFISPEAYRGLDDLSYRKTNSLFAMIAYTSIIL